MTIVKNVFSSIAIAGLMLIAGPVMVQAQAAASPEGCNADRSVVNIARSSASASLGETITFTVEAGNPASNPDDGCDIVDRTMTLTLPNGDTEVFGPFDYLPGDPLTVVDSVDYVAAADDLTGNAWTATVAWTGTLLDGFDSDSTGSKSTSVVHVPTLLEVSKTADSSFDRTISWSIDKTVDINEHALADGQSATSAYDIAVDKSVIDSNYEVTGTITVANPALVAATITDITDVVSGVGEAVVDCPVAFPYELAAGAELVCTYSSDLPNDADRTNTVTVSTSGLVEGGSDEVAFDFAGVEPNVIGFDQVTITDTNDAFGGPIETNVDAVYEYDVTFTCNEDEGLHPNTATIVETEQSDNASVAVSCANPAIDIEKATNGQDADTPTGPTITVGEQVEWTYVVTNTGDVPLTDVVVSDDQGVSVTCPQTALAVGEDMTCTASGTAVEGQYANLGTVSGSYEQVEVTDTDPSHYFGEMVEVQYCSPGYWKQSQHFGNWNGYSPDQSFSSVFGETITIRWSEKGKPAPVEDPTLLQALEAKGGDINMLSRATVGALLNAATLETTMTTDEVIAAFAETYPGSKGDYQALAELFTTEHNCPLGR